MSEFEDINLTATGSGKSEAEVAFELLSKLKGQGVWGERNMSAILDMYAECLDAAKGLRAYEGQKRVEVAIQKDAGEPTLRAAPPQTPVNTQPSAATRQAAPQQQPQAVQQQQPVHAQQQAIAQAYKPAG